MKRARLSGDLGLSSIDENSSDFPIAGGCDSRLLRLNVGGLPFDVIRDKIPLLSTMMTDRWLKSCLLDSDRRIFVDRDGEVFKDILQYFRAGADFIFEMAHDRDRLKRLKVEADYYGIHDLVETIDIATVGERICLRSDGWARVAGRSEEEYKTWSWSYEAGNHSVLQRHASGGMVVMEEGTYLLLVRVLIALPSPLSKIRLGDNGSKEVEEDYFVTVNIASPMQTIIDAYDESQSHFALVRCGLWDYRSEEEVKEEDPIFATVTCAEVISLQKGDVLSVSYYNEEESRDRCPFPDDTPPELLNSLTLIEVHGDTLARFERRKTDHLVRSASWTRPKNDFVPTPFDPKMHENDTVIETPTSGDYLVLGRAAIGCERDAKFLPVLEGGPPDGHRSQLYVRSVGGRLLHTVGSFVFDERPKIDDLDVLSENGAFNDMIFMKEGSRLSISTTGDAYLDPEGCAVGPFCNAVSQSLSLLLLSPSMQVDRFMAKSVRVGGDPGNQLVTVGWFHTKNSQNAPHPALMEVEDQYLVLTDGPATVLVIGAFPPFLFGYTMSLLVNDEPVALSITPETMDNNSRHKHYFNEVLQLNEGDKISIGKCVYGSTWQQQTTIETDNLNFDTRIGHLSFLRLQDPSDAAR